MPLEGCRISGDTAQFAARGNDREPFTACRPVSDGSSPLRVNRGAGAEREHRHPALSDAARRGGGGVWGLLRNYRGSTWPRDPPIARPAKEITPPPPASGRGGG